MLNFFKKFIYYGMQFIWHKEACILCKALDSQEGFCSGCRQDITPPMGALCPSCALPVEKAGLCGRCLQHPMAFDAVYAARPYTYPLTHLIYAFKYQKRLSFAKPLAQLMLENIPPKTDILIPMPLHFKRLQERGFNQSQMLASYLAQHTKMLLLSTAVTRIRNTPKQSLLNEQMRHSNLRDAFYIHPKQIEGLSITLIDDVITSGASLHALAQSLKKAGAASVICWVLARTQPHHN